MRSYRWVGPLACAFLLSACATIFTGSKDMVNVTTEPPGATVTITRGSEPVSQTVVAPATVELKKGKAYTFQASLDGYQTTPAFLDTEFEPWFLGNIICGGIIGIVIDIVTGAYVHFEHDSVAITLAPIAPAP